MTLDEPKEKGEGFQPQLSEEERTKLFEIHSKRLGGERRPVRGRGQLRGGRGAPRGRPGPQGGRGAPRGRGGFRGGFRGGRGGPRPVQRGGNRNTSFVRGPKQNRGRGRPY